MENNKSATVGEKLQAAAFSFTQKGIESARLEAELLLADLLKTNRTGLLARLRDPFPEEKEQAWQDYIQKRQAGWPLQYITGKQEFCDHTFQVTPAVLIPRPETEELVQIVLKYLQKSQKNFKVIDVGTGSGAIIVSIALAMKKSVKEKERARESQNESQNESQSQSHSAYHAIDISPEALAVAQENAKNLGLQDTIEFTQGDLLEPFLAKKSLNHKFNVIVSNPPYIESEIIGTLQKEVAHHEPHRALDGGIDGLDLYRRLIPQGAQLLHPEGLMALEIGYNQGQAIKKLLQQSGFTNIQIHQDYQNHDRIVTALQPQNC
ncbi:peptide chain release factor N(5)-glutamine methyltransferase [Heliorestis acidaminivorans]|uniref:Release factor glutamine methyltransferase n=1 Tax=Heliorestis acidaminivorans TaxID=553427 RepID=A0A6I0EW38_9FIRM|nr:peptide chain release factor N(5)-glutamine methyltransferase [Heliorestis acidaminivorans]KAB2953819.1 peptide chain release factor N(5)-glutamine methyltransferase [Heliorestis acidaminivorans]